MSDKLKNYILAPTVAEAAYMGNIGFEEMTTFYKVASKKEIKEMENIIKLGDWEKFKNLIFKVTGKKLK
jgi:hypothetical protein